MPKNTLLFPPNFVFDTIGAESGISGLQITVNNLAVASKSGAMRQAHALGVGGRNSIKNQNKGMPTLNSLLPTRSVGKYTVAPSTPTGTRGYILSGYLNPAGTTEYYDMIQRRDRFTFASDTMANIGNDAGLGIHIGFQVANPENGYFAWFNNCWRFRFSTETTTLLGVFAFPSRYQGASLKTPSRGYFCDGNNRLGSVDRFSFVGEVCVSIGSLLQGRNYLAGCGNKFNGYILGGDSNATRTSNIERFSYASESKVDILAALSVKKDMLAPWIPGSTGAAYLMGGYAIGPFPTGGSAERAYFSNTVEKFTFTGETNTLLGSNLSNGISGYGAVGNASRAVITGGQTHADSYATQATTTIQVSRVAALTFATEVYVVLSCALSKERFIPVSLDNSSF